MSPSASRRLCVSSWDEFMSEWKTMLLEDVTTKIGSGATPRGGSNVYRSTGVKLIRSQNVLDNAMRTNDIACITDEAANSLRGVTVESGDVLLNITGDSIARCAVVDRRLLPARVNQHVAIIRTTSEVDPQFLQRYLVNPVVKEALIASSSGATRNALTKGGLGKLVISFPNLVEQEAIAEVLGALDAKISANTKLIFTMDAHMSLSLTTAISKERRTVALGDVVTFHNRRRIPLSSREREARPGIVPYFGASGAFDTVDVAIFDEPLVLVGEDGSVINSDGTPVVQYIWGPAWVNNHAHVLTGVGVSTELLYIAIARDQVATLVTGAVQPKINMGNLKRLALTVPAGEALREVEGLVGAQTAAKRLIVEESRTLAATRDALLPQLMSGKLRVRDAEKSLAGVL